MGLFTHDIVVSNPIPQEVKIYYSKDSIIIRIASLLVFFTICVFWLLDGQWLIGAILCLLTVVLVIINSKGLFDAKPQIVINTSGMQTTKTPFHKWSEIKNERVSGKYEGKGARPMLEYDHPGGNECVKVELLNITPQDLNILLSFYRKTWVFQET